VFTFTNVLDKSRQSIDLSTLAARFMFWHSVKIEHDFPGVIEVDRDGGVWTLKSVKASDIMKNEALPDSGLERAPIGRIVVLEGKLLRVPFDMVPLGEHKVKGVKRMLQSVAHYFSSEETKLSRKRCETIATEALAAFKRPDRWTSGRRTIYLSPDGQLRAISWRHLLVIRLGWSVLNEYEHRWYVFDPDGRLAARDHLGESYLSSNDPDHAAFVRD
jgi:hypothetical protein